MKLPTSSLTPPFSLLLSLSLALSFSLSPSLPPSLSLALSLSLSSGTRVEVGAHTVAVQARAAGQARPRSVVGTGAPARHH